MMEIAETIESVRSLVKESRTQDKTIGFVPTMGALHIGHISLIQAAREKCDFVVVSIFVNPAQFGPGEDFEKYPRPVETDLQICKQESVDVVFMPTTEQMYPTGNFTWVNVEFFLESVCLIIYWRGLLLLWPRYACRPAAHKSAAAPGESQ